MSISYEILGFRDVHREHQGKRTHWIALDFKVLVDKTMVGNGEPEKITEIGWFSLDNLPKDIHSQLPEYFRLYRDKLYGRGNIRTLINGDYNTKLVYWQIFNILEQKLEHSIT